MKSVSISSQGRKGAGTRLDLPASQGRVIQVESVLDQRRFGKLDVCVSGGYMSV